MFGIGDKKIPYRINRQRGPLSEELRRPVNTQVSVNPKENIKFEVGVGQYKKDVKKCDTGFKFTEIPVAENVIAKLSGKVNYNPETSLLTTKGDAGITAQPFKETTLETKFSYMTNENKEEIDIFGNVRHKLDENTTLKSKVFYKDNANDDQLGIFGNVSYRTGENSTLETGITYKDTDELTVSGQYQYKNKNAAIQYTNTEEGDSKWSASAGINFENNTSIKVSTVPGKDDNDIVDGFMLKISGKF